MKNIVYTIVYWIVALLLISLLLTSLSYSFSEALLIATLLLPGAIMARFCIPKIQMQKTNRLKNLVFFSLSILVAEYLLIMLGNHYLLFRRLQFDIYMGMESAQIPEILLNSLFIVMLILVFGVGDYFVSQLLKKSQPSTTYKITFISDRRKISLLQDEIIYVESNDTEVWINATEDRRFRNKTPISQWETLLGTGFLRVHRAFLVNVKYIDGLGDEGIRIGDFDIPVSRKYKDDVQRYFEELNINNEKTSE